MSELEQEPANAPGDDKHPADDNRPALKAGLEFGSRVDPAGRAGFPLEAWAAAALIVIVAAAVFFIAGRKAPVAAPSTLQQADAYAASLPLTQLAMSESESLSGGKMTYLDGRVTNTSSRTVTGVTVQVVFANDEAMAPQVDTLPLTLIRVKEPYIDVEPVSADPLKPGESRDFRLIFETVPEGWNTEMPEVRVIHTELR